VAMSTWGAISSVGPLPFIVEKGLSDDLCLFVRHRHQCLTSIHQRAPLVLLGAGAHRLKLRGDTLVVVVVIILKFTLGNKDPKG